MNDKYARTNLLRSVAAAGLAGALCLGVAGCKSKTSQAPIVSSNGQTAANGGDPALANEAQPYTGGTTGGYGVNGSGPGSTTRVLGQNESYQPQASGESYGYNQQAPAPIVRGTPDGSAAPDQQYPDQQYSDTEEAGEQAIAETDQAPPPLPEYDQPPAPDPNYLWTPGYWNYAQTGYYWVPGLWVAPPFYGALWTPPYWGFYSGHYLFHRGYWGPHVGYYGGINYGFGYIGHGYFGGYWHDHDFVYNRAVTNINPGVVHNFYDRQVVYNGHSYGPHPTDRVSYNGGRGGINVQPRPAEIAAMHEAHYAPIAAQREARVAAASNRGQFFRADGGHPAMAFASRPVGSRENIAAAPREQPFNRTAGGAHGAATPGNGFHGAAPNVAPNRMNNPGVAGHETARPGTAGRAAAPHGFEANRGGAPAGHPGPAENRGNSSVAHRGPEANHAGPVEAGRPGFAPNRGNPPSAQPRFGGERGGAPGVRPNAGQPSAPGGFHGNMPAERAPAPVERRAMPAPNGRPEGAPMQRQMAPRQMQRPAPMQRQEAPQMQRPQMQPRSMPTPAARPAPSQPAARPAPAPHGGGGGEEHGGHH